MQQIAWVDNHLTEKEKSCIFVIVKYCKTGFGRILVPQDPKAFLAQWPIRFLDNIIFML